jgi:hypothetical protein
MDKNMKATKDFEFVLKVLESCKNIDHLKSTQNLFINFKEKWKNKLECYEMVDFMFKFEQKKIKVYDRL